MADDLDSHWQEIVLINEGVYKIWDMYITWYTWFFGANLLVLSWIFLNPNTSAFASNRRSVCAIWIAMNLLGTTTSLLLSLHSSRVNRRIDELLVARASGSPVNADDILPRNMTAWGGVANAMALLINVALWIVLYRL